MPLIDDIKEQHKSVAGKSFKYKLQYFLDYYKWATIGVIVGIIVIISIVKSIVTAKDTAFGAVFINSLSKPSEEVFAEYIGVDTQKEEAVFDDSYSIIISDNPNETTYTNLQKLLATISAGVTDVIVGDGYTLEYLSTNEYYADLRTIFTQEELDAFGDKIFYTQYIDPDTEEPVGELIPVLIDITDSPLLKDCMSYAAADRVSLAFVVNSDNMEYSLKFFDYLYDEDIKEAATVLPQGF